MVRFRVVCWLLQVLEEHAFISVYQVVQKVELGTFLRCPGNNLATWDEPILEEDGKHEPCTLVVKRGCREDVEEGFFLARDFHGLCTRCRRLAEIVGVKRLKVTQGICRELEVTRPIVEVCQDLNRLWERVEFLAPAQVLICEDCPVEITIVQAKLVEGLFYYF